MTLFLHEVHHVRGAREEEFEELFRDGWMAALADGDDGRLLWYCNQAHGAGPAYTAVTVSAVADGAAYERLARRVQTGDLRDWAAAVEACRHDAVGKLLLAVPWSPLLDVDLGGVPADPGADHELSLYMEDTGWPHAPLDDYLGLWERIYLPMLEAADRDRPRLLDVHAVFQTAHGAGRRPEAILMQKIVDHRALLRLLETETAPEHKRPGSFMQEALQYRDRWESRLLRTSRWSPLW